MQDARVQKTIAAIRRTFFAMLLDTPYKKITVTALCQRASINKKTFYRYYETLEFLFAEVVGEYADGFIERIKNYRVPDELDKINREFFTYSVAQGKVYEKIICCPAYDSISEKMVAEFISRTWSDSPAFQNLDESKKNILTCFIHNVGLELYRQWIKSGKNIPLEEIISLSNDLLCRGVFGFMKD